MPVAIKSSVAKNQDESQIYLFSLLDTAALLQTKDTFQTNPERNATTAA